MRGNTVTETVVQGKALNMNGQTIIREDFRLGEGWYLLLLELVLTTTNTTGTGAISEGELNILKSINFRTDKDDMIYNNLNGRSLYRLAHILQGVAPAKDAIAATAGTYKVLLPMLFANPQLMREEDTILNTARYKNCELIINMGGIADLLTSVGDGAVTASINISVVRTQALLEEDELPVARPYFATTPQINPATLQYIDLEKSPDLALLGLLAFAANSVTSGLNFSGTPANTVITDIQLEDSYGFPVRKQPFSLGQAASKQEFGIESMPAGWYPIWLAKDRSILSAYPTGDKSKEQINWTNVTLSTSGINAVYIGIKEFKS